MSKYKEFIATVDENLRVINQELFDIFSIMQMNGTHAGMITERIEWAHGKLKGITELHEQALTEAEDMKAKVNKYIKLKLSIVTDKKTFNLEKEILDWSSK